MRATGRQRVLGRGVARAAALAAFVGALVHAPAVPAADPSGAAPAVVAATPLWPDAPIVGQRLPEGIELRAHAGGPVIADHLGGLQIRGDYAYLYRKVAGSDDDSRYLLGAMGRDGRLVVPIEYSGVDFNAACACFVVERDGKHGLLDAQGRPRAALVYDRMRETYRGDETLWEVEVGPRSGVIDARTGAWVLPAEFVRVVVEPAMILAKSPTPKGRDETDDDAPDAAPLWHAFDRDGRPIANIPAAQSLRYWARARAVVVDRQALYTAQGELLIPTGRYFSIQPQANRAIVGQGRSRYGLIDTRGKEVVPPRYDGLWALSGDDERERFGIRVSGLNGDRYGMIDADGKRLIAPTWTALRADSANDSKHRQREDEPAPRRAYLQVHQGHQVGLYDLDGKQLLAPIYDEFSTDDYGTPWMLVRKGGQSGLYDLFERKFTIAPGKFADLLALRGIGTDDELFTARWRGRTGVVDRAGKVVVPFEYDTLVVSDRLSSTLAGSRARKLNGIALERGDDGQWRIRDDQRPVYVEQRYDAHPLAVLLGARIDARYVPEGYDSAAGITAAFAAGKLEDANAPSILLSDQLAYVGFGNLRLPRTRPALPMAMTVCREDEGFRLLTTAPADARAGDAGQACADEHAALQFHGDLGGQLICEACARLGYPRVWLRQDVGPSCALPDWQAETAAAQWRAWQSRFGAAWKALPSPTAGLAATQLIADTEHALEASLAPTSRASLALAAARIGQSQWDELLPRGAQVDARQLTDAVIEAMLRAVPAGQGAAYPEPSNRLPQCTRVWYLKIEDIEAAVRAYEGPTPLAWANAFRLPAAGRLVRNAYPFATFAESEGQLRLAGISREFVEAVAWYLATRPDAR